MCNKCDCVWFGNCVLQDGNVIECGAYLPEDYEQLNLFDSIDGKKNKKEEEKK